jgi:DNA replication protein DnaC
VGKSHLAQALAHEACRQGCDGLFINTPKMLQHLHGGRADGTWTKRLSTYLRPELLVLDDFRLKPLVDPAPSDLYDVINERYETGGILVTSNRAPPSGRTSLAIRSWPLPAWIGWRIMPKSSCSPGAVSGPRGANLRRNPRLNSRRKGGETRPNR